MNQITTDAAAGALQPQQVEHMQASLPALRGQLLTTEAEARDVAAAVATMEAPATRQWTAQRIATLLGHYFAPETHDAMMEAAARDWLAELDRIPQWAIEGACAWWLSRDNPKRRNKPLPGDIGEKAGALMAPVRIGQIALNRWQKGARPTASSQAREQDRKLPSDARRKQILADAGFGSLTQAALAATNIKSSKVIDPIADAIEAAAADAATHGAGWIMVDQEGRVRRISPGDAAGWVHRARVEEEQNQ